MSADIRLYKETGGVNWCLCKVIAEYDGKIWLHNVNTGSMPMKKKRRLNLEMQAVTLKI